MATLKERIDALALRVGTEFKTVRAEVLAKTGVLANLTTTAKGDLVAAVNEVNAKPSGGGASINDAAPAATTTTYSASKIEANDATAVKLTGAQTVAGVKTFSSAPVVPSASFPTSAVNGLDTALTGKAASSHTHTASAVTDFTSAARTATINDAALATDTTVTWSAKVTNDKIQAAITALIAGAPGALDTLDELAAAIGDNASYAASITTALAARFLVDGSAQTISSTNQGIARTNLGVPAGVGDVGVADSDFVAVFNAALL